MKLYMKENISFIKKYNRLTYDELASKIGCTTAMLKTYTGKGVTPPMELLCSIADFAGITLDNLVREKLTDKNYISLKAGIQANNKKVDPLALIKAGVKMLESEGKTS